MTRYSNIAILSSALLALSIGQFACSGKSSDSSNNRVPSAPVLLQPLDGTAATPTSVLLTWKANDPDGDSLTFDLFLDITNPPTDLAISNLPDKSLLYSQLSQGVTYFWRVTATDPEGLTSQPSSVSSFAVGSFELGWHDRQPMPTSRLGPASAVLDNRLYVIGGLSYHGVLDLCQVYDPLTDTWHQIDFMPTRRAYASAVDYQGKIYVLGGEALGQRTSIVHSYDPQLDRWSQLEPLPSGRSRFGAGVLDGKIYTFGGYQTDGAIYRYEINSNEWQQIGMLPKAHFGMSVTVHNGLFYIIGGSHPDEFWLTDVTVFDPASGIFSSRAPMPTARRDHRANLIGDKIYITGGMNAIGPHIFFSSVEVYDVVKDKWMTRSRMKHPRHDHAAGVINGKLYTAGGLTDGVPDILNSLEEYDPLLDP